MAGGARVKEGSVQAFCSVSTFDVAHLFVDVFTPPESGLCIGGCRGIRGGDVLIVECR